MKKFLLGMLAGYIVGDLRYAWYAGYFHRSGDLVKKAWVDGANDTAPTLNYQEFHTYVVKGILPDSMAGERYFSVTLTKEQYETAKLALEQLSAGDDESARENEAVLRAFVENIKRIR